MLLTGLQTTPFSATDWNVLQGRLYAVNDYWKDQISFHNCYATFCQVNLEVFSPLGRLYCLISAARGNIVFIDTGTKDTIHISFTLAIRYIDVSVNRYTPRCHIASLGTNELKVFDVNIYDYVKCVSHLLHMLGSVQDCSISVANALNDSIQAHYCILLLYSTSNLEDGNWKLDYWLHQ